MRWFKENSMYNCEMCNESFENKVDFFAHPHIIQKMVKVGSTVTFVVTDDKRPVRGLGYDEPEPVVVLSLHDAAEQALWDLKEWVKDHPKNCECYTCCDSIPDLERALGSEHSIHGPCC